MNGFIVMAEHVKRDAAAKADHHDIPFLRVFELFEGVEFGFLQKLGHVRSALDGGETVIGDDKNVGLVAHFFFVEHFEDFIKVLVAAFEGRE